MEIRELTDGIAIAIKVQPRSSRNCIAQDASGGLKVYLTTPPVDGAANQACIEQLASLLKLPKGSVTLLTGHKSRNKVIKLFGVTKSIFLASLQHNVNKN